MKKFFTFLFLCLVVSGTFGMKRDRSDEKIEDEQAPNLKRPRLLSEYEQKKMGQELRRAIGPIFFEECSYEQVQEILELGVDPNQDAYLSTAATKCKGAKLVSLLLKHGADPNLAHSGSDAPLFCAHDFDTIQVLVRHGADLNLQTPSGSQKGILLNIISNEALVALVWTLRHGAHPNGYLKRPINLTPHYFALHEAIAWCDLPSVIALIQFGAHVTIEQSDCEQPVALAYRLYRDYLLSPHPGVTERACAQYELLRAFKDQRFDLDTVRPIGFYTEKGISRESAQLIIEATKKVADTLADVIFDDFKYAHRGQNLTSVILDHQLGMSGRRRK